MSLTSSGGFVTNGFYYPEGAQPEWLSAYNETIGRQVPAAWKLLMPREAYAYGDDRSQERPPGGWTNVFPHTYAPAGTRRYFDQLRYSPDGDRITMGLARVIIENESLGKDEVPDLLAVQPFRHRPYRPRFRTPQPRSGGQSPPARSPAVGVPGLPRQPCRPRALPAGAQLGPRNKADSRVRPPAPFPGRRGCFQCG